jgi:hypothetical protein
MVRKKFGAKKEEMGRKWQESGENFIMSSLMISPPDKYY